MRMIVYKRPDPDRWMAVLGALLAIPVALASLFLPPREQADRQACTDATEREAKALDAHREGEIATYLYMEAWRDKNRACAH